MLKSNIHMQDQNVNPKVQDHVTFRTCINPRAVKAAEKVGGAAAQYAGLLILSASHMRLLCGVV